MTEIPSVTLAQLALGSRTRRPLYESDARYLQQWPPRYVALQPGSKRMEIAFTSDTLDEFADWISRHPEHQAFCLDS